jgi:hypothetical protein
MRPAAPNALHCSPAARSLPDPGVGRLLPRLVQRTLAKSPLGGVTIRNRQSSVITATQFPVVERRGAARRSRGLRRRCLLRVGGRADRQYKDRRCDADRGCDSESMREFVTHKAAPLWLPLEREATSCQRP